LDNSPLRVGKPRRWGVSGGDGRGERVLLMGKLVAGAKGTPFNAVYEAYEGLLTEALRLKSTVKKNTNVLHHMMGYFKRRLSSDEKQESLEIVERYRLEHVPPIVPVTLINHYVRKYHQRYLKEQYFLNPPPAELQLRDHV